MYMYIHTRVTYSWLCFFTGYWYLRLAMHRVGFTKDTEGNIVLLRSWTGGSCPVNSERW